MTWRGLPGVASSVLLVVGAAARCAGAPGPPPPAASRHSLLVIVADDLGVDGLGVYAEAVEPPPTPNLDALARRGVLFRNAWAHPVCSPTRAAILTGRHPLRTRIGAACGPRCPGLDPAETTLPEALDSGRSGYAHAAIGKWHLSDYSEASRRAPGEAGWSHYVQGPFSLVRDVYEWQRTVDGVETVARRFTASQLVDDALAWISRQEDPWLCYLAFYLPHGPWMRPPAELHTQDLSGFEERRYSPDYYRANVEAMDSEIGRLLGALDGLASEANVIFIGDNGTPARVTEAPFVKAHAKGTPYEGGVNVPLLVAGPDVGDPGREETALVAAVDLFSTILELAGVDPAAVVEPGRPIDSVSLVPLLRAAGAEPVRSMVYAERFEPAQGESRIGFRTVRDRRYKLVRYLGEPRREKLYDLERDPWESRDLLDGASGDGLETAVRSLPGVAARHYRALAAEIERIVSSERSWRRRSRDAA